jgi:hypothetical protein
MRLFWRSLYRLLRYPNFSSYTPNPTVRNLPTAYMLLEYIDFETGQMLRQVARGPNPSKKVTPRHSSFDALSCLYPAAENRRFPIPRRLHCDTVKSATHLRDHDIGERWHTEDHKEERHLFIYRAICV